MRAGLASAVLCLAAGLPAASAFAQASDTTAVIRGVRTGRVVGVFDETSGDPVSGVEVKNLLNGLSAETSKTGTLSLFFVDTSGALLSFRKLGYEPQTMPIANGVMDTVPITIVMRRAQMLPTVETRAKATGPDVVNYSTSLLRGFEERRHSGYGQFVAEAELRKHEGEKLSDVVPKYVTGVALTAPATGPNGMHANELYLIGQRGQASIQNRGPCYSSIYVDGALIYNKARGINPPDLRSLNVSDYAGVEYYAGGATLPPQFNATDSGCGTLLLWTKER